MKKLLTLSAISLFPIAAFAQNNAEGVLDKIADLIDTATPIVFSLALLFFFWGLATFILSSGEDQAVGKQRMIYGIIALLVMFSVWGILRFAQDSLGLDDTESPLEVPKLNR